MRLQNPFHSDLQKEFYRGRFSAVVQETLEGPRARMQPRDTPFVVGALSFLGRIEDALNEFKRHERLLSIDEQVATRFFLGVGQSRRSRHENSRRLFGHNLSILGKCQTPIGRFFAWQGAGFFRHFGCRYSLALRHARHAWEEALSARYTFGQVLSSDLMGHSLVQTGQISRGLRAFSEAFRLAESLGNGGISRAIEVSRLCYQAQFGVISGVAPRKLATFAKTASDLQDTYSMSNLLLELARQQTLRGDVSGSERTIVEARRRILEAGHPRQKATLHHRIAYNAYLRGDHELALKHCERGASEVDPKTDLLHRLQCLGLRLRILRVLGSDESESAAIEVAHLTARTGSAVAASILAREEVPLKNWTPSEDDRMGRSKDEITPGMESSVTRIQRAQEEGLTSFLRTLIPKEAGNRHLLIDVLPGRLLVFDRGDILMPEGSLPRMLKLFLLHLGRGPMSKRDLVRWIWGYSYHPLRHDPLLYTAVARIRKLLGDRASWIESCGDGYRLGSNVTVSPYDHVEAHSRMIVETQIYEGTPEGLNTRQVQALEKLREQPFFQVAEYARLFKISKPSACRDLTALLESGLVRRWGKGRATAYGLAKRLMS